MGQLGAPGARRRSRPPTGSSLKQVSVNRRQRLAKVDRVALDRLHDEAAAAAEDYEVVRPDRRDARAGELAGGR